MSCIPVLILYIFFRFYHYNDVIMDTIGSQITSPTIVYSTIYSDADQRKHQSSASLAFEGGNSPRTGEFPEQMVSNAENVSIWWRHHVYTSPKQYIVKVPYPNITYKHLFNILWFYSCLSCLWNFDILYIYIGAWKLLNRQSTCQLFDAMTLPWCHWNGKNCQ